MKNLAGDMYADNWILVELDLAGIDRVEGEQSRGEVPYSIRGKVGYWTFSRAWYYWVAHAPAGEGLPLDEATELHERRYPITGKGQPKTYGQVIRVAGNCECPPPLKWAKHYDAQGLELIVDPNGKKESECKSMVEEYPNLDLSLERFRFVPGLEGVVAKSVIDCYHIDTQVGLNEFARVVREL